MGNCCNTANNLTEEAEDEGDFQISLEAGKHHSSRNSGKEINSKYLEAGKHNSTRNSAKEINIKVLYSRNKLSRLNYSSFLL